MCSECGKDKDDDHNQDPLTKDLLHIWSWSSHNVLLPHKRLAAHTPGAARTAFVTQKSKSMSVSLILAGLILRNFNSVSVIFGSRIPEPSDREARS